MDRLTRDLSKHLLAGERAELGYSELAEARAQQARFDLEEDVTLKTVLEDEELATPLARIFRNLDRAFSGDIPARDAILQASEQMRRQCYDWLLDR